LKYPWWVYCSSACHLGRSRVGSICGRMRE
jgi:hypothetical protein